jgi:hypothetical protein
VSEDVIGIEIVCIFVEQIANVMIVKCTTGLLTLLTDWYGAGWFSIEICHCILKS